MAGKYGLPPIRVADGATRDPDGEEIGMCVLYTASIGNQVYYWNEASADWCPRPIMNMKSGHE